DWENLKPPLMEGLGEKLAKAKSKSIESDLNGSKKLQPVKASHWLTSSKTSKQDSASSVTSITDGLKRLYI
ncbi:hypothetical protein Dimus_030837, partial [Dionaea muscipula]